MRPFRPGSWRTHSAGQRIKVCLEILLTLVAKSRSKATFSRSLLSQLRDDIASRNIDRGFHCLAKLQPLFGNCHPGQNDAAVFLGYLAQWVDIGFSSHALVKELLNRFPAECRSRLSLFEFVHLQMAHGMVAMFEEDFPRATRHFELVLALQSDVSDQQVIAIANFWMGRCLRRQGRYADALVFVDNGRKLALKLKYPRMAAVMQVLEGWIAFQDGRPEDANRIFGECQSVLHGCDDYVTLGNISSAYGRVARRLGNYEHALQQFQASIDYYSKRNPNSRNLARSYVNIAFVKRLLALQLSKRLDTRAAQLRKKSSSKESSGPVHKSDLKRLFNQAREKAVANLAKAQAIYDRYDDHRGNGNVFITHGYLYLDNGELDRAAAVAVKAFNLGDEKQDSVLKGRARILQCSIECAKHDEQLEEGPSAISSAQLAAELAREALRFVQQTQNRRLIAKAYIALGIALCLEPQDDVESARKCADEAALLLTAAPNDYVWKELQELRRKLRAAGNISATLRQWSEGIIGDKSFEEVSEEFAALVIPKVWRREGQKVARVAARLAISPKKVRRILRRQGLIPG